MDVQDMGQRPPRFPRTLRLLLAVAALTIIGFVILAVMRGGVRQALSDAISATTQHKMYFIPSEAMLPTLQVNDHILCDLGAYSSTMPKRGDIVVLRAPPHASPDGVERDFIKRVIGVPGDEIRIEPGYVMVGDYQYCHQDLREHLSDGRHGTVRVVSRKAVMIDGQMLSPAELAAALGEPGKKVTIVPGRVLVNGKAINEPYINEDADRAYPEAATSSDWEPIPPSRDKRCVKKDKDGKRVIKIPRGKLLVLGDNRNNSSDSRCWGLLDVERVTGKATRIIAPAERASPLR